MEKRTSAIAIGIVIAAVGSGVAYYAYQSITRDQSEVAFKYPSNNNGLNNSSSPAILTGLNSNGPRCSRLIINDTGTYCVTSNGMEFEPRKDSASIYQGGFQINLCESFISQNRNNSNILTFDKYHQPVLVIERGSSNVAVPICYTSTVGHELLWHPMIDLSYMVSISQNGTSHVTYDQHVKSRVDKASFTVPAFNGELLDYENPLAPRGNFTVFITSDSEALLGHHSLRVDIGTPQSKFGGEFISGGGTGLEFDLVDST